MVTVDLTVGQSYPVSNGQQSANFAFSGMYQRNERNVLVFGNPSGIGTPFPFIGAVPELLYPNNGTGTVSITVRLRARWVGMSPETMTPYYGPDSQFGLAGT